MHKINIPAYVDERSMQRRGRVKIYDQIDPARTAHIIVDLQNGFMAPGEICEIGTAREIVPNVNSISAACHRVRESCTRPTSASSGPTHPNCCRTSNAYMAA